MAQNFTSLVPRQKWFHEKRNMQIGDVVLIQYMGKCRPATYRLGVVIEVEVDDDGLVRTVSVEYSLLSELSEADRLLYKGITKKRLRVPVQRLVLILPVEERVQVLPGVQAGADPAPLEEVCDRVIRTNSYDVVWWQRTRYMRGSRQVLLVEGSRVEQTEENMKTRIHVEFMTVVWRKEAMGTMFMWRELLEIERLKTRVVSGRK